MPSALLEARRRMLRWPNPVEVVNNMYGCHPGDPESEESADNPEGYFATTFGNLGNS
ncbi:MAG: hypothetical protein WC805_02440 [Patescibacteria group bacterium]|jgi:hypothetical protein